MRRKETMELPVGAKPITQIESEPNPEFRLRLVCSLLDYVVKKVHQKGVGDSSEGEHVMTDDLVQLYKDRFANVRDVNWPSGSVIRIPIQGRTRNNTPLRKSCVRQIILCRL